LRGVGKRGEFGEVVEAEQFEEAVGSAIQDRTAGGVLATHLPHQTEVKQRLQSICGVDAPEGINLRSGDGLVISDYRQSFQQATTEFLGLGSAQASHILRILRFGEKAVAAGNRFNADAAPLAIEPHMQKRGLDLSLAYPQDLGKASRAERLFGHEK